jgi:hypothetical protein
VLPVNPPKSRTILVADILATGLVVAVLIAVVVVVEVSE